MVMMWMEGVCGEVLEYGRTMCAVLLECMDGLDEFDRKDLMDVESRLDGTCEDVWGTERVSVEIRWVLLTL
jgi:hypothetical protein